MNRLVLTATLLVGVGLLAFWWLGSPAGSPPDALRSVSDRTNSFRPVAPDLQKAVEAGGPSGTVARTFSMQDRVRKHLAGVLRGWSEEDDELLGRSIDDTLALGWSARGPLLEMARSGNSFEERVFALELALRLGRKIRGHKTREEEVDSLDRQAEELVRSWLSAEEEALLQMVGGEEGDVLLAAWVRKIRGRMATEALLEDLDPVVRDLEGQDPRLSWRAAVRMTQALDSVVDSKERKRLVAPLSQALERQLREGAPGREAGLLSMLGRVDPEAARQIAVNRLQDPGSTSPASLELAARLLAESSNTMDRDRLLEALGHESEDVRLAVASVWAAGRIETTRVTRSLLRNLSPEVKARNDSRQRSLHLLAHMAGRRLVPPQDVERTTEWTVERRGSGDLGEALRQELRMAIEVLAEQDSSLAVRSMAHAFKIAIESEVGNGN